MEKNSTLTRTLDDSCARCKSRWDGAWNSCQRCGGNTTKLEIESRERKHCPKK